MKLPPPPSRMKVLKLDERGFPVPWFVHWEDGKPDFRIISPGKLWTAYSLVPAAVAERRMARIRAGDA
jgi:hypothetical protein